MDAEGSALGRLRVATPRHDYDATLEAIAGLVRALEQRFGGPASVGVGMPGIISPASGLVKNANSTWLIGRPFDRDLVARPRPSGTPGQRRQLLRAIGSDRRRSVGCPCGLRRHPRHRGGGGLVIDGRILEGAHHIAGEWGHNPLPAAADDERPGPPCYCGRRGCIETFLSGPGWTEDTARRTGRHLDAEALARARPMRGRGGGCGGRPLRRSARPVAGHRHQPPRSRRDRARRRVVEPGRALRGRAPRLGRARVLRRSAHSPGPRASRRRFWRTRRGVVVVADQ